METNQKYLYLNDDWANFTWDASVLESYMGRVRFMQGRVLGQMDALGFNSRNEALLENMTINVQDSSKIEGENPDYKQVRSSVARKLGMTVSGLVASDRDVDGIVEMTLDATQNYENKLSTKRLYAWHSSMFPNARSGMYKIEVGKWRDDALGEMQIVSGVGNSERVHFQAPPAKNLNKEMKTFLKWVNADNKVDNLVKSGVAHLWFATVHPFDDGNGRIARALSDMLLARSDNSSQRFYSLSAQILKDRKNYYKQLELAQMSGMDVTQWLVWFLDTLYKALLFSEEALKTVMLKHKFWLKHSQTVKNERQIKVLNKVLDGFEGKLTSSKWAKMGKCSKDTALRDIQDLVKKGILSQNKEGGRSVNYSVNL